MSEFTWDQSDPLARCPRESQRANDAFRDYVFMGSGRSLRKLLDQYNQQAANDPPTKPPTVFFNTLSSWSNRFEWQARLERWTNIDLEERQLRWVDRQEGIREDDFAQGQALRDLGSKILAEAPNFTKTRRRLIKGDCDRGIPDREIITMALDAVALTRVLKLASELQRSGAEMPTERTAQIISGAIAGLPNIDLEEMDDAQISEALSRSARVANEIASRIDLPKDPEAISEGDPDGAETEES